MQNNVFLGDRPVCVCQVQKIFSVVLKLDIIAYTNICEASIYLAGIMMNMQYCTLSLPYFFFKQWQLIILCKHCKLLYRKLIYPCSIYLIYQHRDKIQKSLIQITGLCLQLSWHIHDWGHNSQIPVISPWESRENGVTSNYCGTL